MTKTQWERLLTRACDRCQKEVAAEDVPAVLDNNSWWCFSFRVKEPWSKALGVAWRVEAECLRRKRDDF